MAEARRILIAEIKHEANTFSPVATTLNSFRDYHYLVGPDVEKLRRTGTEVGAFLDVASNEGWEVVPALAAMAMSSGKVTAETYASLKATLLRAVRQAKHLDGVLLALHGAMVVEGLDDAEGDLLTAVRSAVGRLPIVATLDLHAKVTQNVVQQADILVGFDTCPHTDLYDTGERAARLFGRLLRGEISPVMALLRVPLIVPPDTMDTGDGPLGEIVGQAKAIEGRDGVLSASVFCVQPWLDVPDLASAVVVITDGDADAAEAGVRALGQSYWSTRHRFRVELHSPEQAIRLAIAEGKGPVVFSDSADSIGSGATGDATGILRALLAARQRLPGDALTTVVDPQAAEEAIAAGVGAEVMLTLGGKRDTVFNQPVMLRGQVRGIFDGHFRLSGPSYTGLEMNMGGTAVVRCDQVFVVITSLPTWTHHPDFYRAVGLRPERALIVVTKSNILFKASYCDLARRMLWIDAAGLSSPNLVRLPYRRITRPLFPFDDMESFDERVTLHIR